MKNDMMKTGTTTMGLVCKDGIVLAADRRVTASNMIVNKKFEKIYKITNKMAITTAGSVSDVQLLVKLIKAELRLKKIRTGKEPNVKECANLLAGFIYSNIRKLSIIPGISHFVLGGADEEGFHLYDLYADGSLTKSEDFVASGSGSVFAYGVLETLYKKNMPIEEVTKLAVKSINAALQRDSASGDGLDIVAITDKGVKKILEKEINVLVEA